MSDLQGMFFWGFLLVFGVVMYLVVPRSRDEGGLFRGQDEFGRPANEWALVLCIFFSWVFNIFKVSEYSKVLIMFYVVSYGLSIIENVGEMGIPLPKWLMDKFKVLQEETNKGVESDEIKRDK